MSKNAIREIKTARMRILSDARDQLIHTIDVLLTLIDYYINSQLRLGNLDEEKQRYARLRYMASTLRIMKERSFNWIPLDPPACHLALIDAFPELMKKLIDSDVEHLIYEKNALESFPELMKRFESDVDAHLIHHGKNPLSNSISFFDAYNKFMTAIIENQTRTKPNTYVFFQRNSSDTEETKDKNDELGADHPFNQL